MKHTKQTESIFDEIIERRNTDALKYDMKRYGKPENMLPFWIADMDFRSPEPVSEALMNRVAHGIFGYGAPNDAYYDALRGWFRNNFHFDFPQTWVVRTPGVIFALSTAIRALTDEGDAVLINRPVYYPFSNLINRLDRKLVNSPLVLKDGHYEIDFDDLEKKIDENDVRLYLLCSPHNPVGRVWTRDELKKLADICLQHDVIVVSDEIHCDFVWSDHPHTIFASLGEKYQKNCIICTAPSKTFNLAGLNTSNIIIPDSKLRRAFRNCRDNTGVSVNIIGPVACQAAYEKGLPWLTELRAYIRGNIDFVDNYLKENIPQISLIRPEGTYLLWLDMRSLGLSEKNLERLICEDALLWLDSGSMFGPEGIGFQRINAACPRSLLTQAMENLNSAVRKLQ